MQDYQNKTGSKTNTETRTKKKRATQRKHSDRKLKPRIYKYNTSPHNTRTKTMNDTKSRNVRKIPKHMNTRSRIQCHDTDSMGQNGVSLHWC